MVAGVASEMDLRDAAATWSYPAALGLALIYLAGHYLVEP
jgi:hypothetical protein